MLQTSVSTVSVINLDKLCYYIETLKHHGVINKNDDYELIAEAVSANFDEIVEYEDIEEYFKAEQADEEMMNIYRNCVT